MLPHGPSIQCSASQETFASPRSKWFCLPVVACIVRCLFVTLFISYFIADSFLVDASSLIQNAANRMITMEITESFRRDDMVIDTTLPLLLKLSRKSADKYLRFIVSFCVHWSRSTYWDWWWKGASRRKQQWQSIKSISTSKSYCCMQ